MGSPRTTQPHKPIRIAAIDQPLLTRATRPIVNNWLHAHSITDFELLGYVLAEFLDHAAELVAEGYRDAFAGDGVGGCWADLGTPNILVQVAATDAAPCGLDLQHIRLSALAFAKQH